MVITISHQKVVAYALLTGNRVWIILRSMMRAVNSIPSIPRLDYIDWTLAVLAGQAEPRIEDVRVSIGRSVEELALRGEAHRTRDGRNPGAYRDTTVDCLRELMRWELVAPVPLANGAVGFDRIRNTFLHLTPEGHAVASLAPAERREVVGQYLVRFYKPFLNFLHLLSRHDVLIPELPESRIKAIFKNLAGAPDDQDAWVSIAEEGEKLLESPPSPSSLGISVRSGPRPSRERIAAEVGRLLRRRFRKRAPLSIKELTGAINKAVAQAFLQSLGFAGDWNAYDRCLRWARDLLVANYGRHVFGVPGWLSWATAEIHLEGESYRFERRGYSRYRNEVGVSLIQSYREIGNARRGAVVQVPLVPIFEVRETAAFRSRVCDEVVDRVLAELAFQRRPEDLTVQLHLADMRAFVPSARPFRHGGLQYYYVTMYEDPVVRGVTKVEVER